ARETVAGKRAFGKDDELGPSSRRRFQVRKHSTKVAIFLEDFDVHLHCSDFHAGSPPQRFDAGRESGPIRTSSGFGFVSWHGEHSSPLQQREQSGFGFVFRSFLS